MATQKIKGFSGRYLDLHGKTWNRLTDKQKDMLLEQDAAFQFLNALRFARTPCHQINDNPLIVTNSFMHPQLHQFILQTVTSHRIEITSPVSISVEAPNTQFRQAHFGTLSQFGSYVDITVIPIDIYDLNIGHKNILIVNHVTKEIEYFDPMGPNVTFYSFETQLKERLFNMFPDYKFIELHEFCQIGPQQNNNTCVLWTLLYQKLRIEYPTIPRSNIIQELRKEPNALIYGFHCYLLDQLEQLYPHITSAFIEYERVLIPLIRMIRLQMSHNLTVQHKLDSILDTIIQELTSLNSERYSYFVEHVQTYKSLIEALI